MRTPGPAVQNTVVTLLSSSQIKLSSISQCTRVNNCTHTIYYAPITTICHRSMNKIIGARENKLHTNPLLTSQTMFMVGSLRKWAVENS